MTIFSHSDWLIWDGEASLLWIFLFDWPQLWLQDTIIEPSWGYRRLRVKRNGLRTNLCQYARVLDHTSNGKRCGMIKILQWPSSKPGHSFLLLASLHDSIKTLFWFHICTKVCPPSNQDPTTFKNCLSADASFKFLLSYKSFKSLFDHFSMLSDANLSCQRMFIVTN